MTAPLTHVVAGNGPSLADIQPGRVLADDFIIRTNSFFAEPQLYVGNRVDMAVIGGDPRVAPFVFETIKKVASDYTVKAWTAPQPKVTRIGQRRLTLPYRPFRYATPPLADAVQSLCFRYAAQPTAGVVALYLAHARGAERIVVTGLDLYSGPSRYCHTPGPRMTSLMGADFGTRGYDRRLHNPDLDCRLIELLQAQPGLTIQRAGPSPALEPMMDLAPERPGSRPTTGPKHTQTDWVAWAGIYPIWWLRFLRRSRAAQRSMTAHFVGKSQ